MDHFFVFFVGRSFVTLLKYVVIKIFQKEQFLRYYFRIFFFFFLLFELKMFQYLNLCCYVDGLHLSCLEYYAILYQIQRK